MPAQRALTADRLVDGVTDEPIRDGVVLTDGARITAAGPESEVDVPAGATVVDLGGYTLMPGLIDAHLHLASPNAASFRDYRIGRMYTSAELFQLYSLHHARMIHDMGFTTLRVHANPIDGEEDNHRELVAIREAIERRLFRGPRLRVSGLAHITNSHFDVLLPKTVPRDPAFTADGPWELREQVRRKLRNGVDCIKTVASGGGGTDDESPTIRNMCQEEIDAIVDETHAFGKQAACHCFTPESQRMAVEAGIDTLEHIVFTDDETLDLIEEAGTTMIPTLAHRSDRAIRSRERVNAPQFILEKMKRIQPYCYESFQDVHGRGIDIAMGTDINVDPEVGTNAYELELYVELGMSEMEAIRTATHNAARALQLGDEIGTLEAGKKADVIAVRGDPTDDITHLQEKDRIGLVMKEGRIAVNRTEELEKAFLFPNDEWDYDVVHEPGAIDLEETARS